MNITVIIDKIEQLPPEAQQQIEYFIAFLKARQQSTELTAEEFIAILANDENTKESTQQWLENMRNFQSSKRYSPDLISLPNL